MIVAASDSTDAPSHRSRTARDESLNRKDGVITMAAKKKAKKSAKRKTTKRKATKKKATKRKKA